MKTRRQNEATPAEIREFEKQIRSMSQADFDHFLRLPQGEDERWLRQRIRRARAPKRRTTE